MSFERAQWAFPVVVTLHNLEEAVWLPKLWQERAWRLPVNAAEFRAIAAVVAALAYLVTYMSVHQGKKSTGAYVFAIFLALMLVNSIWHLTATLYLSHYAPGVVTAVFLVAPVTIYLLREAVRKGYV